MTGLIVAVVAIVTMVLAGQQSSKEKREVPIEREYRDNSGGLK